MEKVGEKYEFMPEDECGFLHGEIRVAAVKVLIRKRLTKEVVVVGGPIKDGQSKVELIAEMIKNDLVPVKKLESRPNTRSNVEVIKNYLSGKDDKEKNGLLTNFYHLPRALRLISENGYKLVPIAAEAVLLADDPHWESAIKRWYSEESMKKRLFFEIKGLAAIEKLARFK
jgi:hypothetical protein